MKNVFTYLVLVVCIAIYVASLSEPMTKKIAAYKHKSNSIFRSDKYRYGDLFGMSYYPGFQIPLVNTPTVVLDRCDTTHKAVDLYALCDSYVWSILPSDTFYCNINKLQFATLNKMNYLQVQLDTTKANIMLIEFAERSTTTMLQDNFTYLNEFVTIKNPGDATNDTELPVGADNDFLFNKNININIEFNVFETAIFTPVRKLKTALNYTLFKTADTNVAIGPDGNYLLYKPTVDPTSSRSSFRYISDTEIDTMVNRLNAVYFHYKQMGFREVYFSMIPNPVTILYPNYKGYRHNQLIQRIQRHAALQIPVIDIYSDFVNTPFQIYQKSDSHWNIDGAYIWVNKLNNILRRIDK